MPRLRVTAFALFLFASVAVPGLAQDLRVYHIDVGQADAQLIIGPTGIACLVDGGDPGDGNGVVVPLLNQLGVTQLKWIVVSHFHSDHYGGVIEVCNAGFLPQVAVYDRGSANQPSGSLFSQYLSAIGVKRTTMSPGVVLDLGGGATLTCLAANGVALGGGSVPVAGTSQEENSRSIAMKLAYGNYHEALCGDLTGGGSGTANVEAVVAPVMGNVDVYKVNHHGSFTSSSASFVSALAPEICSISCGDSNPYGHPHQSVMSTLAAQTTVVEIYRLNLGDPTATGGTVVDGTLLIQTDGQQYTCSGGQVIPLTRNVDETGGGPPPSTFSVGDVVVSEFFPNPNAVPDSTGEWLELRNATSNTINLVGFVVRDQGIDSFQLPSLQIAPHAHVTLASSASSNGGFTPSYVWPFQSFFLANATDEIEVVAPGGLVVDGFAYGSAAGIPIAAGASIERKDATAPPWPSNFANTLAGATFGLGDRGTPNLLNSQDHTPPWPSFVSAGAVVPGGLVTLTLFASGTAGKPYQLALSDSKAPGIVLPTDGRTVDLALGWLLDFSITPNNGITSGFSGAMSGLGHAVGSIALPNVPALSGFTFYAAGAIVDAAYPGGVGSIAPTLTLTIL
jgi:competence protein ComEC